MSSWRRSTGATAFLAAIVASSCVAAEPSAAGECIDISNPRNRITLSGRLTEGRFESPSVSAPPEGERALILTLREPICIDDGGEFADPARRFDRVHVWGPDAIVPVLTAAVGRDVEVSGEGYAAHTGHHHAPLVLTVDRVVRR